MQVQHTTVEETYATARQRLRATFAEPYEQAFRRAVDEALDAVLGPAWSRLHDQEPEAANWSAERVVERLAHDLHRGLPYVGSFHEMVGHFVEDALAAGYDAVDGHRLGSPQHDAPDAERLLRAEAE